MRIYIYFTAIHFPQFFWQFSSSLAVLFAILFLVIQFGNSIWQFSLASGNSIQFGNGNSVRQCSLAIWFGNLVRQNEFSLTIWQFGLAKRIQFGLVGDLIPFGNWVRKIDLALVNGCLSW
jgi:hypothetical protein